MQSVAATPRSVDTIPTETVDMFTQAPNLNTTGDRFDFDDMRTNNASSYQYNTDGTPQHRRLKTEVCAQVFIVSKFNYHPFEHTLFKGDNSHSCGVWRTVSDKGKVFVSINMQKSRVGWFFAHPWCIWGWEQPSYHRSSRNLPQWRCHEGF